MCARVLAHLYANLLFSAKKELRVNETEENTRRRKSQFARDNVCACMKTFAMSDVRTQSLDAHTHTRSCTRNTSTEHTHTHAQIIELFCKFSSLKMTCNWHAFATTDPIKMVLYIYFFFFDVRKQKQCDST